MITELGLAAHTSLSVLCVRPLNTHTGLHIQSLFDLLQFTVKRTIILGRDVHLSEALKTREIFHRINGN